MIPDITDMLSKTTTSRNECGFLIENKNEQSVIQYSYLCFSTFLWEPTQK